MNTPKSHLWKLIQSLTPAEKRYFKTHFASESSQLTTLFDTLNAQTRYEEARVKDTLGIPSNQYKVLKHQLQDLILKSLVANNGKRNAKSKVRIGLEEVDLLLEREHFEEATKKLRRLGRICHRFGFTLYQYEVRERLHEIQHLELDFSDPQANKHYGRLVHLQRVLAQKQKLSAIQQQLEDWNPFTPERHKVIEDIRKSLLLFKAEDLDQSSFIAWMQNMALCTELLGDEETAIRYREYILENFANEPALINQLPLTYLLALKYAATAIRSLPSIDYVNKIAVRARRVIAQHPQYSPHYIYFLWARLQVYYMHKDWGRMTGALEQECADHLKTYALGLFRTTLKIYVLLAVAYLIRGQYEKANNYLTAFRKNKMAKDESLHRNVNLLELILLLEDQNLSKLRSRIRYFQQQLKKGNAAEFSPLYNFHLKLFSKIAKDPFAKDELTANALLRISEFPFDPILYYYAFFHIERWLQASASRKKWIDTV